MPRTTPSGRSAIRRRIAASVRAITSSIASTRVRAPWRSQSAWTRATPWRHAAISASRSPRTIRGYRTLLSIRSNRSSQRSPPANRRWCEKHIPSWKTSVVSGLHPLGCLPPMSAQCAVTIANATSSPPQKIGAYTDVSEMWVPVMYGSFTIRTSPSRYPPRPILPSPDRTVSESALMNPAMPGASAHRRPSPDTIPSPKSCTSYSSGLYAVRTSVRFISRAAAARPLRITSVVIESSVTIVP